jgi:hypothetical protein
LYDNLCPILPPRVCVDANPEIGAYFCLQWLGEDMNRHARHVDHMLIAWGARGHKFESCRPDQLNQTVICLLPPHFYAWGTDGGTSDCFQNEEGVASSICDGRTLWRRS